MPTTLVGHGQRSQFKHLKYIQVNVSTLHSTTMAARFLNSVVNLWNPTNSSERSMAIHQRYFENEDARHLSSSTVQPGDAQVPKKESTSSNLKSDPVLKAKKRQVKFIYLCVQDN